MPGDMVRFHVGRLLDGGSAAAVIAAASEFAEYRASWED